jgi:hypothetical protein
MLLTRCMAGCLSGNVAVVKASLGEMTDSTNQGVGELPLSVRSASGKAAANVNSRYPEQRSLCTV